MCAVERKRSEFVSIVTDDSYFKFAFERVNDVNENLREKKVRSVIVKAKH